MAARISPESSGRISPLHSDLVTAKPSRRSDLGEVVEVEIDDLLKRLGGGSIAQAFGQGVEPSGILGLQSKQLGDGVSPALRTTAPVCCRASADRGLRLLYLPTSAVSRLSFGIAEGVLGFGFAASWHGLFTVT
jgi:hypothetical protein